MAQTTFTPCGNTFIVPFTATASNVALGTIPADQQTLFKIDNASGNLCFITFSTSQAVANSINHPTAGNSTQCIAVRTGATEYVNPNLGILNTAVYVGAISVSGTGNIYIQPGV